MSETEDIRADFLVEAGELLEQLSQQLVDLEARPDDAPLLNAVFRAFHTVKGGAGFLALQPMVDLCHAAEDQFNAVRSGKRKIDAALLDAALKALDHLQSMMGQVRAGEMPAAAPAAVIAALKPPAADANTITEDEFESLLDELQGKKPVVQAIVGATPVGAVPVGAAPVGAAPVGAAPVGAARVGAVPVGAAPVGAAPVGAAPVGATHGREEPSRPWAAPTSAAATSAPPSAAQAAAPTETTVRVDTTRLDKMMNLVGELVLVRNRLKALRAQVADETVLRGIGELDFITRGLQNAVMQIRMQPIRKVFSRFPRLARDVARAVGKQVDVELSGEDTDLDKNLVEALADPLVHMVRNSVDHGIEMPEERRRRGKPEAGRLSLSAQQEGDHILITVRDDGAGMDPERLRAKAQQKGLLDAATAAALSSDECLQLVFLPGFSTKDQVSELSGRGVGMDVVQSRIRELNGSVSIDSKLGQGTSIRIRVPLTLAILPALMVQADGRVFALPLACVQDVFALETARIRRLNQWDVVLNREQQLRLIYLDPWLQPGSVEAQRHVVVTQVGDERYGFVVRDVRGREEVVIKPLGATLRGLAGVAGATVLPNGDVALIVDFPGLVRSYRHSIGLGRG